jgi:hypothetical protein
MRRTGLAAMVFTYGCYGAAASMITMLIWIYYAARIVLFGAEFTQVYAQERGRSPGQIFRTHQAQGNRVTATGPWPNRKSLKNQLRLGRVSDMKSIGKEIKASFDPRPLSQQTYGAGCKSDQKRSPYDLTRKTQSFIASVKRRTHPMRFLHGWLLFGRLDFRDDDNHDSGFAPVL